MIWNTRRMGIAAMICVATVGSTAAFQRGTAVPTASGTSAATAALLTPVIPAEFSIPTGVGELFFYVVPAKAADFDLLLTRLKGALAQSKSKARREQANGWKVFKSAEVDPAATSVIYVWLMEPAMSGASYDPIAIFNEEFPSEVQPLTDRLRADIVKVERMSLTPFMTMGISK